MSTKNKAKTPKQAVQKIGSLLKGIDNSVIMIDKHRAALNSAIREVKSLMGGIGSAVSKPVQKPAPKPAPKKEKPTPKPTPKKEKPAPKPAPKKEKPAPKKEKPAPKKPTQKAKADESSGESTPKKAPVDGRPSLKEAVRIIISESGPMPAAEIWKRATAKYGYWSRQSLYNVLKDKSFSKAGEKFAVANAIFTTAKAAAEDVEVEKFCKQVEGSSVVDNVQ